MKKVLVAALLIVTIGTSCKKDNGQCYACSYGVISGYQKPADTYCGDIGAYRPKDAQGNDIPYYCQPK